MSPSRITIADLPPVRGRYTENAPLGALGWFRAGGCADILFKPEDLRDLADFLAACPAEIPVTTLGVLSNVIVRDGGVRGVVIRMGRDFADLSAQREDGLVHVGAATLDANVARFCAQEGLSGLSFLSGIPGTIGGALRINAGAYGSEIKDILVHAHALDRAGRTLTFTPEEMGLSYRHSSVPEDVIFTGAALRATPGANPAALEAEIDDIRARRESSQPIREKTGGSTFANPAPGECAAADLPEGTKAWQIIDRVGGRGLRIGDAVMSEKHCNFMINAGAARGSDLEALGEEIRRRVRETFGVILRWEIRRIGQTDPAP